MIFMHENARGLISGRMRGSQIASRIDGATCNPKCLTNFNQTFIFVKCLPPQEIYEKAKNVYVDLVDNYGLILYLKYLPNIKIIAFSELSANFLASLLDNEIVVIKQQHCNFELETRPADRPIKTVGYCGEELNFTLDVDETNKALTRAGFDVVWCTDMRHIGRQDVCEFYKSIDIHIAYRNVGRELGSHQVPCMKDAVKLQNASSFKIPSVCFPEPSYVDEFDGMFIPVLDVKGMVDACVRLRDDKVLYDRLANGAYEKAMKHNIENILPLYKELDCVQVS